METSVGTHTDIPNICPESYRVRTHTLCSLYTVESSRHNMDVLGCVREEDTGHARHRKSHILGFPLPISPASKREDRTQGLDHARQVLFCLRQGLVIQTLYIYSRRRSHYTDGASLLNTGIAGVSCHIQLYI